MSKNPIENIRHSTAHLLAAAVLEIYPKTKLGVGPVIENGFFYDMDVRDENGAEVKLTDQDLLKLEKRMRKIIERGAEFKREEMPLEKAINFFREKNQDFKVELLNDIKTKGTTKIRPEESQDVDVAKPNVASVYWTGNFVDLCRGPHVNNARELGAFKLNKLAGAYWRGNEKNKMLTRVYGLAFDTQDELDAYIKMQAEAEARDHRKLGAELDLFAFSPLVGSGLPLFTPRGTMMRKLLEDFVGSLQTKYGFERVWIPHITKSDLYKTSGHWDKFEDDLFHVSSKKSEEEFVLKPMNCPHHTQIFASRPRSYRDLPIRYAENTTVYRDENTGQLQGLSRVRSITQDDAHVFCSTDQVEREIKNIYTVIQAFYKVFKMPLRVRLSIWDSKKPEKYLGGKEVWQNAVDTLEKIAREFVGDTFEWGIGEAAFYGPKLDFIAKDAIGREWQLATIQLDFNQPERFGLEYTAADGTKHRPVMIHRAILGSVERFFGIIIEHYAGAFPTWLAPVQIGLVPVGKDHVKPSLKLAELFGQAGLRVSVDDADETVGNKIRKAIKSKVPYMLVIGDAELPKGGPSSRKASQDASHKWEKSTLAVRARGQEKTKKLAFAKFLKSILKEVELKK